MQKVREKRQKRRKRPRVGEKREERRLLPWLLPFSATAATSSHRGGGQCFCGVCHDNAEIRLALTICATLRCPNRVRKWLVPRLVSSFLPSQPFWVEIRVVFLNFPAVFVYYVFFRSKLLVGV